MKILKLNIAALLSLLLISNCAIANYHASMFQMLKSDLTPHSHKVKKDGDNSFPKNGMGIVSLNFITGYPASKHSSANTLWRKINKDGTYSDRISLTYSNPFKSGRLASMLEPGIYFLDGINFPLQDGIASIGAFNYLISNKQKGWDEVKKKPLWFSFKVEEGKEIFISDAIVFAECKSGANSCYEQDLAFSIKVNNEDGKYYEIGYMINSK